MFSSYLFPWPGPQADHSMALEMGSVGVEEVSCLVPFVAATTEEEVGCLVTGPGCSKASWGHTDPLCLIVFMHGVRRVAGCWDLGSRQGILHFSRPEPRGQAHVSEAFLEAHFFCAAQEVVSQWD